MFQISTKIDILINTSNSSVNKKGNVLDSVQEFGVYFPDEDKLVMERSPFIDPPPGGVVEKTVDETGDVTTACVTSTGDTPPVDDTAPSTQVV